MVGIGYQISTAIKKYYSQSRFIILNCSSLIMCSINARNLLLANNFSSDELPNDDVSLLCNYADNKEFNNLFSSTYAEKFFSMYINFRSV